MISLGRETVGDAGGALGREWLVTNGLGGYACGTLGLANTRSYHGLLLAAVRPPVERALLLAKLDGAAIYAGRRYELATNERADGTLAPQGYRLIERFWLDGSIPTWRYALGDALLELRIWMQHGANTTYITYTLARAAGPLELELRALVSSRDHHATLRARAAAQIGAEPAVGGLRICDSAGAHPWRLLADLGTFEAAHELLTLRLRVETERGQDDRDTLLHLATHRASLRPGQTLTLVASTEADLSLDGVRAYEQERDRQCDLLDSLRLEPPEIKQLALAADQFIVERAAPGAAEPGKTIIAGYPWFGDWGRDTMISLPGLALATGRPAIAASILRTFARYLDRGMLPNRFPDVGEQPEYNTVDATLWYLHAVYAHSQASGDLALARELWPALAEIIAWHERGTRYQIGVDARDGLLYAGEPGVQLSWMDVKIGDWVVTPRQGKAVEINALWINGLRALVELGAQLDRPEVGHYRALADRAEASFLARFVCPAGHLYDVIDTPEGDDARVRPNQLFAISLPFGPLARPEQRELARAVLDICARELLTSHGLRSLALDDIDYIGSYGGTMAARDRAYHQGTVWGWLIGAFVEAHLRVYGDRAAARACLDGLLDHLRGAALGTQSEIFDGDPPFAPRGCFAQAWSVAEILRAWRLTATG